MHAASKALAVFRLDGLTLSEVAKKKEAQDTSHSSHAISHVGSASGDCFLCVSWSSLR